MLEYIKSLLFKKKIEIEEVKQEELREWLDEKAKPIVEKVNGDLKGDFSQLKQYIDELKAASDKLEQAEIKDPDKIQPKVKQVVLGHRDNYVKQARIFFSKLELKDEVDYRYALEVFGLVQELLDRFTESTKKSYQASQHLFFDDVEAMAKLISKVDKNVKGMHDRIVKAGVKSISDVHEQLDNLDAKIKLLGEIKEDMIDAKIKEEESLKLKQEIEKRKEDYKKSEEFSKFNESYKEKDEIDGKIKHKESDILNLISPLSRPLRKYSRIAMSDVDWIEKYVDDPVKTFSQDKELKILNVVANMKKSIESNGLELKQDEKERALNSINHVDSGNVTRLASDIAELNNQMDAVSKKISSATVDVKLKDFDYRLDHVNDRLRVLEQKILGLKKKSNLNINELREKILETVKEGLYVEVKLV